ncbi:MAG TPA: hypothetical protein VEX15_23445 [Nocardioidaceae bacterium]|nr:hypothetical protein [Nocardioidaceae bacterium]
MPSNRRRQRSVRITAAVLLLVVAGLVVIAALLIAEVVVLAGAAVAAFVAGVCAVRLVLGELVRSRRTAAEDRAGQARAYQQMDARRVDEHTAFATLMTTSLDDAKSEAGELRGTLRLAERRAELAEQRARHEARRRGELQTQLDDLATEPETASDNDAESASSGDADDGAPAVPYWDPEVPTVVDLLSWEDRDLEIPDESDGRAEADLA